MRKILFTQILSAFLIASLAGLFFGCVENCSDEGAEEICASVSESVHLENAEADFCAITEAPAAVVAPPEYFAQTDFVRLAECAPELSAKKNLSAIISKQTCARHFKPPFQILRQLRI